MGTVFEIVTYDRANRRASAAINEAFHEIERLDEQLGAFRGRIKRDRIVEQADYLARGDTDGFEQRFGAL